MRTDIRAAAQQHRNLKAELLALYPELAEDDQALADTLEGISRIDRVIAKLIEEALFREALVAGIAERMRELAERKSRLSAGAEKMRSMALWAMGEAGLLKLTEPEFTATAGVSRPSVVIVDEAALPDAMVRVVRSPDKTLIGAELKLGHEVPGAMLSNPRAMLTVKKS